MRTGEKITSQLNIAFDKLLESGVVQIKGDVVSMK
jgi:hypothetical protein